MKLDVVTGIIRGPLYIDQKSGEGAFCINWKKWVGGHTPCPPLFLRLCYYYAICPPKLMSQLSAPARLDARSGCGGAGGCGCHYFGSV